MPSLLNVILFIYLTTNFTACSIFDKDDPCDGTVMPEIEAGIKATIHVFDKDKNPIPNQQVNLYLYNEPCSSEADAISAQGSGYWWQGAYQLKKRGCYHY